MVYSTIHPPLLRHTLSVHAVQCTVYSVHLVWERGGGEEVREKIEGQQYTSIVHLSMGATLHKLGWKPTSEWMYLQSIKSVKFNAAISVNRSILKKSRHKGFGVFIVIRPCLRHFLVFLLSVWQVDVLPILANRRVEDSVQRRMTTTFCCHGNWQWWLISPSYMTGRGFSYISLKGTHFHDIKKASPSVLVVPWLFPNINNIYCWTFS
jgi:hypothetical protein